MIQYPNISPEIVRVGPLAVRWYGLMYVIGYGIGFQIAKWRRRTGLFAVSERAVESLVTYLVIGMLIGARLTYALVYNWDHYGSNPLDIFKIWHGGLSFHGAALGMITASWVYARKFKIPTYMALDNLAMTAPPGLFFGRFGNFFNAELYGRPTDLPWAMVFPTDPAKIPRHPSQIYEAFAEGLLLFLILHCVQAYFLKKGRYRLGYVGATFLMGYGFLRFLIEYTRQPDEQLGFVLGSLSMGQILCAITFVAGVLMWARVKKTSPVFAPKPLSA